VVSWGQGLRGPLFGPRELFGAHGRRQQRRLVLNVGDAAFGRSPEPCIGRDGLLAGSRAVAIVAAKVELGVGEALLPPRPGSIGGPAWGG
jgi:hypothetical protein